MRKFEPFLLFLSLFLFAQACQSQAQQAQADFRLIKKTTLGGDGFWDYLCVDTAERKLYVSHGTQVLVLNADTHEQLGAIPGQGIHGVTIVPALNRGYITNGRANTLTVFDTKTLVQSGEIAVGKNPDAALYDPFSKRLFVFDAGGEQVSVIDPAANAVVGTLDLGGSPEAGVTDGKGTIYVNLEDKSEIVAFDATDLKVLRRMSLSPGEEPTGLAIDTENQWLMSVCHNKLMIVMNAKTGKIQTQLPIGANVDGLVFDAERKLAIASNGEGSLTVVREVSSTKFKVVQTLSTEPGARTIALDAKTHHVFTATAQMGKTPEATADNPHPRRSTVPGTFSVLEFGE